MTTWKAAARIAAACLAAVAALGGGSAATEARDYTPRPAPWVRCSTPAPTTATGYAAMFARVPTAEFGAADVGITVPLPDGRSVWLWGDTFSDGRFVHSSAIVQDRGCLHVSRAGAQLLPDREPGRVVHWIERARLVDHDTLAVEAEETELTSETAWGFRYTGWTSTALVDVDRAGDLTFRGWASRVLAPQADPGPMILLPEPGHFAYSVRAHPEARMASGLTLFSAAQNWDDGNVHPVADYRVMFVEARDLADARAKVGAR
jgi:hypothetical protein